MAAQALLESNPHPDEAAIKALEWAASNHEKECYLCQSTIKVMGKNSDITPCLEWKKLHTEIERRKGGKQ